MRLRGICGEEPRIPRDDISSGSCESVKSRRLKSGSKRRERTKAGSTGGDPGTQPHLLRGGFPFSLMVLPRGDSAWA